MWMEMHNGDNIMDRPIHYLGSKLRMLETVKKAVDSVDSTNGCICDLFSGSGTVSKYFSSFRNVVAADIQNYSAVLCEATMSSLDGAPTTEQIIKEITQSDLRFKQQDIFMELVEYEKECIANARQNDINRLYEIIEKGSLYIFFNEDNIECSEDLAGQLTLVKERLLSSGEINSLDSIIIRYYGGLYFSYEQALEMDNIEHYVFKRTGLLKVKTLAALLSTASEIVNTVGKQFAQPLKVRDGNGRYKGTLCKKILDDRSLNVYEIYEKWLYYYLNAGEDCHKHEIICDDYLNVLEKLKDSNVSVIYADPPYTRYHYSRYYHVLETICLRDNPNVTTTFPNGTGGISRAIYREGRHQSPFCIKSQAERAFDNMFRKVKELGVPLVLSYSPFNPSQAVTPRLQTVEQLIKKAQVYFSDVSTISPGEFTHSKLNCTDKNFKTNHEAEILILCRN